MASFFELACFFTGLAEQKAGRIATLKMEYEMANVWLVLCCLALIDGIERPIMREDPSMIDIDFLYLDLTSCGRCQGAETNLEEAIKDAADIFQHTGYVGRLNKVKIAGKKWPSNMSL